MKKGDENKFFELTESNPRYLMTPCDTPSVIHSGTRANALHVAAEAGSARMTTLVLEAVQDPELMARMYPSESAESRARRQEYLFDLYLNSHLKASFDTPLHQAAKIGAVDVVAILAQYSSCDTKAKNKYDMTPADAAGTRMTQDDPQVVEQIQNLLSDHVYIPVFRVNDHSMPSFIGEPWSPRPNQPDGGGGIDLGGLSPVLIRHQLDDASLKSVSTSNKNFLSTPRPLGPKQPKSPYVVTPKVTPTRSLDQTTSSLSVRGVLGPMSPLEAEKIKAEWKRPKCVEDQAIRLSDTRKGLERQGRELAKKIASARMIEYWDFLDAYCDLSSDQGLELLDHHLREMSERKWTVSDAREDHDGSFLSLSGLAKGFAGLTIGDDQENEENQSPNEDRNPVPNLNALNLNERSEICCDNDSRNDHVIPNGAGDNNLSPDTIWNRPRITVGYQESPLVDDAHYRDNDDNDDETSLASGDSFHTVASSFTSDDDSILTAEEGQWIYLMGNEPCETDRDVYRIIKDVNFDGSCYPYLSVWKDLMSTVTHEEQALWPKAVAEKPKVFNKSAVSKKLFV